MKPLWGLELGFRTLGGDLEFDTAKFPHTRSPGVLEAGFKMLFLKKLLHVPSALETKSWSNQV
ncbi:UNVERIFIED_CONTAM: hypothetical protein FKN15_009415 [Acipenser sinensis]